MFDVWTTDNFTWIAVDPSIWNKTLNRKMLYSFCKLCTVQYIALVHLSTAKYSPARSEFGVNTNWRSDK